MARKTNDDADGNTSIGTEDFISYIAHLKRIEKPSTSHTNTTKRNHQPRWILWKIQLWCVDDDDGRSSTKDSTNSNDGDTSTITATEMIPTIASTGDENGKVVEQHLILKIANTADN